MIMKTEQILARIKIKEDEISILKNKLLSNNLKSSSGYIYIPEIKKEVEIEVHDKNKSYDDLKNIYGDNFESSLLTKQECAIILKNKEISNILKMDGSSSNDDFFIQQFDEENKKEGYVAVFFVNGGRSGFYSRRISKYAYDFRGVRFCRKKISGRKK